MGNVCPNISGQISGYGTLGTHIIDTFTDNFPDAILGSINTESDFAIVKPLITSGNWYF